MKALVTGGAGFIGSYLTERLLRAGDEVTVIDNLSTGFRENISAIEGDTNFKFIQGSILDASLIETLVAGSDIVYHLAAAVGVQLIADDPVHTIETNIAGTEVVLDSCNKFATKVFLASTSEIYGKSESVPFDEDDNIVLGSTRFSRWSYACSKAIDEFLGLAFYQQYGLEVVIGRFFNTIGPRQSGQYGMVVPRFVDKALNNEVIEIYGDGRQQRCFCYVDDVIEAVIGLMNCPKACGNVYNIGSAEEITIEALADKIIAMTGSSSGKKFLTYEQAYGREIEDMMRRIPAIDKIKEAIGWAPVTGLEKSLEIIIESFKK
ncbi:MAG: NAD-dependent epimerase/dehydratase family protein [Planctomycetes bacterium]|nr:NAD-dependent epimerase/dehydratase family protein [Planctomycetota bacterium]